MELRELDLNLLLVFNQLLIDRRVSTAADNLELTQPAVSNALKRLRTTLNDELFVRTYQGMEPTPYARQLAEPVALAIQTLRDALSRQDTFDPLNCNRRFTMAMTDIGEIYFMPRLMDALAERAPGCSISTLRTTPIPWPKVCRTARSILRSGCFLTCRRAFFNSACSIIATSACAVRAIQPPGNR
ncbi:HTH-type transcriptional regulator YidZ [Pseudomonas fluorescens]|uniref:HTH-type transcriptional regulator YidZ n=1 Tax=Pseudomonas fluorescens TaxID=294 RepID=A0A5E7FIG5_PSEFL|nr:HTH-type transcriptional regulator YidZ [Pseudomonas fluorescens]